MQGSSSKIRLASLILAVALAATYANHFQNGFHFDDFHTITGNPFIRDLRNVPRFFADPKLFSTMPDHATWRPIVSASLAVDYALGRGFKPFWFHLSTFVWFLVQLWLMFLLFRRILDQADPHPSNPFVALFATAVYGLHPAMAETVNYIIQRGDLYCTLGVVASLLLFIAYPTKRKYCLYMLPAIAAYMSKAPALVFPFILLAYVYLFEREPSVHSRFGEPNPQPPTPNPLSATWPAFAVTAAAAILTVVMTPRTYTGGALSAWQYRVTQPWIAVHYLKEFFLPTELSGDTDWGYVSPFSTEAVVGYATLAGLIVLAYWCSRKRETAPVTFGIVWFLLALAPTSVMPLAEVANDHRMFFPFVGLALAVPWGLFLFLVRRPGRQPGDTPWAPVALGIVGLVAFALGAQARNEVWRTEESLWRDVTQKSPRNGRGWMNYGLIFMARGDYPKALYYFEQGLPYTPNYWALQVNLAIALGGMHRDAEAEEHFRRAVTLAPETADPHFYYGRWLEGLGRTTESAAQLEMAVRINRFAFDARDLLMRVYAETNNVPALRQLAGETLQLAPDNTIARGYLAGPVTVPPRSAVPATPEAMLELSLQYFQAGRYEDCIASAKKAIELRPDYAEAYNNLAAAYNAMHRWDEGIQAAVEAVKLKPDFQLARNNLLWAIQQRDKGK